MNPEKGILRRFAYIGLDTIPGHPEWHSPIISVPRPGEWGPPPLKKYKSEYQAQKSRLSQHQQFTRWLIINFN